MSVSEGFRGIPWRRPMTSRDPAEAHRQASFLELFFDLCFVVAIAQAASQLHHALAEGHATTGLISYFTAFFAIWWAWMNFTWFASAYDNDDVPYRVASLVQITGALILAAAVQRAFVEHDFDLVFVGYAVMRVGLVAMWLRAAMRDPPRRKTALRYAIGVTILMGGWAIMFVSGHWPLWGWWIMATIELALPAWAERAGRTPWHPGHIAERYGLFTIIVLGESVLAATNAVQAAVGGDHAGNGLLSIVGGGLLILFSLWWLYFAMPAERILTSTRAAFAWGYGHYFVFAAAAAVGAGLAVNVDHAAAHTELSDAAAASTVTLPVSAYLILLWILQIRPHGVGAAHAVLFLAAAVAIGAATWSPSPVLTTGAITALLVAASIVLSSRPHRRSMEAERV